MAYESNLPTLDQLIRQLQVSTQIGELGLDVSKIDPELLDDFLQTSILDMEAQAHTAFNGRQTLELRDGNGTNAISPKLWPIGRVREVKVELPVLALTRVYDASEVKVYRFEGRLTIFTFKLAAQNVGLYLDQQIYGNIFPSLPQCVFITYTYGFPQYDVDANLTTFDGGATSEAGDTRDPRDLQHVRRLQQAAICDAAACYLSFCAGLSVGVLQSVSFDGFSKTLNPQAYATQAQAMTARRDELLGRVKRPFILASI